MNFVEPGEGLESSADVMRDNVKALFSGKLPRQKNRTLLHEAAKDGAEQLIEVTMVVSV